MRRILLVASMLVVPGSAFAQAIANSPHDLSTTNATAGAVHSTVQTQVCVFCHTPHGAITTTNAIWNKTAPATAPSYGGWGVSATVAGTPLPTTAVAAGSLKCFSCHDGTTDVGGIQRGTDTLPGQWANAATKINTTTGAMAAGNPHIVNPANMAGNHPVSIPYPGVAGNTANTTYNGITSGVTSATALAGFKDISTAQASGIIFYGSATERRGIECGSCHDPHAYSATQPFLHMSNAGSALCLACHTK